MSKPSRNARSRNSSPRLSVAILGRGRAGRALARSLRRAGIPCRFLDRTGGGPRTIREEIVALAVPDDAIAEAARRLAARAPACRLAIHLSGARDASALAPFRRLGVEIASFHPLDSYSGRADESLAGRRVAIEGTAGGVRRAASLARRLGARPWKIRRRAKPAYHAAATLAAGGTAAIVAAAAELGAKAGMERKAALDAFARLAARAADNVARLGWPGGLTGPLARGDRSTIAAHRRALARTPSLAHLYNALRKLTISLGRVDRRARRH